MASAARLCWVERQIHSGRIARVRYSYNPSTFTEKIHFSIEPVAGSGTSPPCVLGAISFLKSFLCHAVVTDKGHSSSKGPSIVEFWIRALDPRPMDGLSSSCYSGDAEGTDGGGLSGNPSAPSGDGNGGVNRAPAGKTDTADPAASMVAHTQHTKVVSAIVRRRHVTLVGWDVARVLVLTPCTKFRMLPSL